MTGRYLHVASVFCHHQPQVHWDSVGLGHGRPELGDFLLVVSAQDAAGKMTDHALLIQAKKGKQGHQVTLRTASDLKQRYMYLNWPQFHIVQGCRGSALKCKASGRRFNSANSVFNADGARYGLVVCGSSPTWKVEDGGQVWAPVPKSGKTGISTFGDIAAMKADGTTTLGEVLEGMVNKTMGRPFDLNGADDWSGVISELLDHGCLLTSKKKLRHVTHSSGSRILPVMTSSAFCWRGTGHDRVSQFLKLVAARNLITPPSLHRAAYRTDGNDIYGTVPPSEFRLPEGRSGFGILRIVVGGSPEDKERRG